MAFAGIVLDKLFEIDFRPVHRSFRHFGISAFAAFCSMEILWENCEIVGNQHTIVDDCARKCACGVCVCVCASEAAILET